jgi:putative ABC transport system substrate-binding protein
MARVRLRRFLIATGVLLATPLALVAQQAASVPTIGYITNDATSIDKARREAFKQGLRDLGYVEGQNYRFEARIGEGDSAKLPAMMQDLLRAKPAVIFAFTTPAILAARNATRDEPVVIVAHTPVELGIVSSLARPSGNLTGLTLSSGAGIYGKYIELLGEIVPNLRRIAVLHNATNGVNSFMLREALTVAAQRGITLLPVDVSRPEDVEAAIARTKKDGAEALVVLPDAMLLGQRRQIASQCIKEGLPSVGISENVDAGSLLGYAAHRPDAFRRAASFVDRILKGAKPSDLPIEQPMKFVLEVNQATAKALGIRMPASVLIRADRVIE